jgi:hypothetical protein
MAILHTTRIRIGEIDSFQRCSRWHIDDGLIVGISKSGMVVKEERQRFVMIIFLELYESGLGQATVCGDAKPVPELQI